MKKLPTLFIKDYYANGNYKGLRREVTPGFEWVLEGKGVATMKLDGSCCAIIDGVFYRRFDAKPGRKLPNGAIPCCPPDPVTGHHPHWVPCDRKNKADKWLWAAYDHTVTRPDGTYEAIGPHFQGNIYELGMDVLEPHGMIYLTDLTDRSFDGIRDFLCAHEIEGIVFWRDGEPQCKIKRKDFGLAWPPVGR